MTEAQQDPTGVTQADAVGQEGDAGPDSRPAPSATSPADQTARLVRDVAAFEVDPPPPARVDPASRETAGSDPAE